MQRDTAQGKTVEFYSVSSKYLPLFLSNTCTHALSNTHTVPSQTGNVSFYPCITKMPLAFSMVTFSPQFRGYDVYLNDAKQRKDRSFYKYTSIILNVAVYKIT